MGGLNGAVLVRGKPVHSSRHRAGAGRAAGDPSSMPRSKQPAQPARSRAERKGLMENLSLEKMLNCFPGSSQLLSMRTARIANTF